MGEMNISKLIIEAKRLGYLEAVTDMDNKNITKRQKHMMLDIKTGNFSTYYNYANRVGISHQSAQQTYAHLLEKGLIEKEDNQS